MKRLVLLVIGLVFLFTTSVFAQAPAAKPGEPAKPAVAAEKKADAKAVDVKAAPEKDTNPAAAAAEKKEVKKKKVKKAKKVEKKAEKKEMKEEAKPAPAAAAPAKPAEKK